MTIHDIAKLAGVSSATVSRALNDSPLVSAETKRKILEIANTQNYEPSMIARGLASRKTYTIGVMIPDIMNSFFAEVYRGIQDITDTRGYSTILYNSDYDPEKERKVITNLQKGRIDGVIGYFSNRVIDECMALVSMNFPFVMLGQFLDEVKCPKVGCNNYSSAYTATEYLIKAGHKNIAHIAGHTETKTGIQRVQGYKAAMENYGLPIKDGWIQTTDYLGESAYEKTMMVLEQFPEITAIFAANDAMAIGCYKAISERGLIIPDDISVIGIDDIITSSLISPPLTTMRQEKRKLGQIGATNLFACMDDKCKENIVIIPTTLIERKSVKKIL